MRNSQLFMVSLWENFCRSNEAVGGRIRDDVMHGYWRQQR